MATTGSNFLPSGNSIAAAVMTEPSPIDPDPYPKYEDEPPPRPIDAF
jgi:hypothetical protein